MKLTVIMADVTGRRKETKDERKEITTYSLRNNFRLRQYKTSTNAQQKHSENGLEEIGIIVVCICNFMCTQVLCAVVVMMMMAATVVEAVVVVSKESSCQLHTFEIVFCYTYSISMLARS